MSIFKRITTTLHASVDKTVASIENHDAIIQATLATSRRSVAEAQVKLSRVQADGVRQAKHIDQLKERIELWTTRAKNVADTDREKALGCLKQRKDDQAQLESAVTALQKHKEMTQRMEEKVRSLQQRVTELQRQHTELQSRDTVSRATTQLDNIERSPSFNIDDSLDRWEVSIHQREARNELNDDIAHTPTSLHDEFKVQEQNEALNDELDALIKK